MPIWFLMVFVVNTADMSGVAKLHVSTDPKYNNEASCQEAGAVIAKNLSEKLPTNTRIMFVCQPIEYMEIKKALPPSI